MADLNYQLDLRSPEFKASLNLIGPGTVKLIFILLAFTVLTFIVYGFKYYCSLLEQKIFLLETDNAELIRTVEPLELISAETSRLQYRAEIEDSLVGSIRPWSVYLQSIIHSLPAGVTINEISFLSGQKLTISGNSPSMQSAALFKYNLENLNFIDLPTIESINLNAGDAYSYTIKADLNPSENGER